MSNPNIWHPCSYEDWALKHDGTWISGRKISNNWLKLHGGIMIRKKNRKMSIQVIDNTK